VEAGGSQIQVQSGQTLQDPSEKQNTNKRSRGVDNVVDIFLASTGSWIQSLVLPKRKNKKEWRMGLVTGSKRNSSFFPKLFLVRILKRIVLLKELIRIN
jgi:hypothetical protein